MAGQTRMLLVAPSVDAIMRREAQHEAAAEEEPLAASIKTVPEPRKLAAKNASL
jgi:hypothetical protein